MPGDLRQDTEFLCASASSSVTGVLTAPASLGCDTVHTGESFQEDLVRAASMTAARGISLKFKQIDLEMTLAGTSQSPNPSLGS